MSKKNNNTPMNYQRQLEEIGLKGNQAKVYLAGLKLGPTQILNLAKHTRLKRTNVHALVDQLMEKGLFKVQISGFKKLYIAESPNKLRPLVSHRLDQLINQLNDSVVSQQDINLNQIVYYKGMEGAKTAYVGMLEGLKPGDTYYVFSETTRWLKTDQAFFTRFWKKRAKMNLDLKLILTDSPEARYCLRFEKNYRQKVKLLPPQTKLDMNLVINPHKILLHKLTQPRLTIITQSPEAASMQKQMFEIMWQAL